MKTRKGFRSITVDGACYLYAVSLSAGKLVAYRDAQRFELLLPTVASSGAWRGKKKDGAWGKRQVAELIRQHVAT